MSSAAISERGSGRTTNQIEGAPLDSIYIVSNHREINHTSTLAMYLKRPDLTIKTLADIKHSLIGVRRSVVIDHHALEMITKEQLLHVMEVMDKMQRV